MTSQASSALHEQLKIYKSIVRDLQLIISGDAPTDVDLANAPFLDLWTFVASRDLSLFGIVDDHPRIGPGPITTSTICALDPQRRWARTSSRWYRLGARMGEQGLLQ